MYHKIFLLVGLVASSMWGCTVFVYNGTDALPAYPPPAAVGLPEPIYTGGDARWLTACEPPSCYEHRVSGGAGVHVGGRVVGTQGVPLTLSGRAVKNGKIVSIR